LGERGALEDAYREAARDVAATPWGGQAMVRRPHGGDLARMTWERHTCLGRLHERYGERPECAEVEQCFCAYAGVARESASILEVLPPRCPAGACEDMRGHGQADAGRCAAAVPRKEKRRWQTRQTPYDSRGRGVPSHVRGRLMVQSMWATANGGSRCWAV